jgi:cytoskeletal protein RodZ
MSALGDMAAGASGLLAGQAWKLAALVLLIVLLAGGGAGGALWWSAATARDHALVDLKAAQGENAQLRAGVDDQNRAIQTWYRASEDAEARGQAAQQEAVVNGRRYDAALTALAGANATTCADAMPYVNQLLEKVR